MAKHVSMSSKDAATGGAFQGGITTILKMRLGYGYKNKEGETTNPEIITLRMTHRPKADGQPRTEYLSLGRKAREHFKVSKDATTLIPLRDGVPGPHINSKGMVLIASIEASGFPSKKLQEIGVTALEGLVFKARQKPVTYEGLELEDDQPRTVLVCAEQGIVKLPWEKKAKEDEDEATTDDEADEADEASEDDEEADQDSNEEDEDDDDAGGRGGDTDDTDADDDSDDIPDDDAADNGLTPAALAKHLKTVLKKAGGRVKVAKLGGTAFQTLRKEPNRNAICTQITKQAFLKLQKGWTYDAKAGTVSLK